MNIAIQLSGMPRNIENSFNWLKESMLDILDKNNAYYDFFIYTWEDANLQQFIETFKPKKWNSERWNDQRADLLGWQEFKNHKFEIEPRSSCLGQFYSINECNKLRREYEFEKNISYDIIIRFRTELKFNNKLDINELNIIKSCEQP